MKTTWWKAAAPAAAWLAITCCPAPAGLAANAWRYFALFAAAIIGLITAPIPAAAIGLLAVTAATVMGYVAADPGDSIQWALSGFSNSSVWLIYGAFVLSTGYTKSGLGRRIALVSVKLLGQRTLGLGYAVALADLLLAPGTPSNTARSGGMIYPVIRHIPGLFGSEPGPTARRMGGYLMWTAFASTAVTSSMFLTSLAPNLIASSLVKETTGWEIGWRQWFVGFLPIGGLLLGVLPLLVYVVYPPEVKSSKGAPAWASQELAKMGGFSLSELVMAVLVGAALVLWIFGQDYVNATTVVLIVISLMILTKVLDWEDILGNQEAWNVLVWFATLVALADGLNRVGFVSWLSQGVRRSAGRTVARARDGDPGGVLLLDALHVRQPHSSHNGDSPRHAGHWR